MIRVGELNRKIIIRTPAFTQDSTGQQIATYSNLASVYARVIHDNGNEGLSEDIEVNKTGRTFITYFRTDVTEKMQIRYDGKDFDIVSIKEIGFRELLEIKTELHQ